MLKTGEIRQIIAENVSEEDYMEHYAESFHEWVQGYVIKMSPVRLEHDKLTNYTRSLLEAYFTLNPIGIVIGAPFVMRLESSRREPDLQVILNAHSDRVKDTYTDGPADICIEVVSPSNAAVDYGAKLEEYEAGGVQEYWMFDPQRRAAYFYRLNDQGVYISTPTDATGSYQTPLLPQFKLSVATLWQDELPNYVEVLESVKKMLEA
jgi:Uma2 family endonuclease